MTCIKFLIVGRRGFPVAFSFFNIQSIKVVMFPIASVRCFNNDKSWLTFAKPCARYKLWSYSTELRGLTRMLFSFTAALPASDPSGLTVARVARSIRVLAVYYVTVNRSKLSITRLQMNHVLIPVLIPNITDK